MSRVIIYIFLLNFAFSVTQNSEIYTFNFNQELNRLSVNSDFDDNNLSQKLNNKYYIDSNFLYELGIKPFSTLYMTNSNADYSISYNILSSYQIDDIDIEIDEDIINNNFSFSETMTMRGIDLAKITFFPIQYDYENNSLEIIEEVEISIIEEINSNNVDDQHIIPISREFEKLLESMVINLEISDRTTDDLGSILYICGGNSDSNSYFQDLVQWRKEQGYKVYIANTSVTGTSQGQIKNYIENAYYTWTHPPEYLVLVGDTGGTYQVGYSNSSGGDSDYPYTLIDGNDLLPEMFVGRISANSSSDLSNIINKTLAYEKATFIEYTGTDWYESSALVGDPSSTGNSAIITNEYIENMLNAFDFNDVETCYVCSYSSWMQNRLEEGILYFNYRGYIGTSGFGTSHINNANNGFMTPFVTFITCSTGSFSGTAISESFIRAGSVSNPKGGVAAVGTATSATHTVPNNIVDMGIYDGIFSKNLKTAGAALVNGKLSLYNTYPDDPYNMTYKFTHWNNLMGDPVLHLWKDTPKSMIVEYPEIINMGTNLISVNIVDNEGNPVEGARVVIYKSDEEVYYSYTDEDGYALINCESYIDSISKITVLKDDHIPFNDSIVVDNNDHIQLNQQTMFYIDDDNPENQNSIDGIAQPGEIVDIYFNLDNLSASSISSLEGYVSTYSDKLDIINDTFAIDNLSPFIPTTVGPIQVYIHEDLIATDFLDLALTITDGSDSLSDWSFNIPFDVFSPNINIQYAQYDTPSPGDSIELNMTFENLGEQDLNNCYASIDIINSLVNIVNHNSYIGNIPSGQTGSNFEALIIEFEEDIIDGSIFNFNINIYNDSGFSQDVSLNITVGVADEHDPLGPDAYGYYIYDWTDVGYSLTPFYDWIELDPSQGGNGIDLGISDSGNGNNITNSTKYIDLPFTFTFYGQEYNEISVNANGWIAFGYSNMESFRNYQLPGAGGPSPMIAAFWDDLKTNASSKVFKYVADDYVVVEWMNMKTNQYNSNETFQVILYDSITPTGDDEIKIQYKDFNNTTNGDYSQYTPYHGCYSTVGIENHQATIGLEYTFDNQYPTAAAPLQNESALFITTRNTTVLSSGDVNQDDEINILDIVMVINHILVIEALDSIGQFVADMDGNGTINILDVILMINLILDY